MATDGPSGWSTRTLFELADYQNGMAFRPTDTRGDGLPIIKIAELNGGIGPSTGRAKGEVDARKVIHSGDLLFAWSGSVGVYRWSGPEAVLNQHIFKVTSRNGVDQRFLQYLLESQLPTFQRLVDDQATTMGHVKVSDLKRLKVLVPPLPEQRAIASILGSLDDKIELNRRMNQTLEEIARALFKFWFVDFGPVRAKAEGRWKKGESLPGMPADMWDLWPSGFEESEIGEIPKGWKVAPLSEAIEVNPPRHLPRGTRAPYVDMGSLPTSSARVTGWVPREFGSGTKFENGDTLVARITPCLENGKTAFVDFLENSQVGWGSTEFIVLRARPSLPPPFTYLVARTPEFRSHLIQNMSGTSGRQRAPAECLDSYPMAWPTADVAMRFGSTVEPWFNLMRKADAESGTLAQLRDALLPKLLSGEIRVPLDGGQ
jgi:type I restriction enzyme S subunit